MRILGEAVAPVTADFSNDTWWIWLIKAVAIVVFLLTSVLFAIWFERKVVARMQVRPGPNVHGPFGLLQSLADAMKLLVKEDMTVKAADKLVYIVAPMIAVFCSLLTFAVSLERAGNFSRNTSKQEKRSSASPSVRVIVISMFAMRETMVARRGSSCGRMK